MTVNHSNLSVMSRLLDYKVVEDTKNNRLKNDCPSQCDGSHCDVCQFGTDYSKVIQTKTTDAISPEAYGRDFY
jgi:hypothetical protein